MMKFLIGYCATLITLPFFDGLWLSLVAHRFYTSRLGFLFTNHVLLWPILIFYPLYAAGLFFFAVNPALSADLPLKAFLLGAFLGLLAYSAYDLTNQATIESWPVVVTIVDMAWGVVLSGITSAVAVLIVK
jgi:uncharacterized membrane protein